MQHLQVSGAVRPLRWPLGVKWLKFLSQVNQHRNVSTNLMNNFPPKFYDISVIYSIFISGQWTWRETTGVASHSDRYIQLNSSHYLLNELVSDQRLTRMYVPQYPCREPAEYGGTLVRPATQSHLAESSCYTAYKGVSICDRPMDFLTPTAEGFGRPILLAKLNSVF